MTFGLFAQEKITRLFDANIPIDEIARSMELPTTVQDVMGFLVQRGVDMAKYSDEFKRVVIERTKTSPTWEVAREFDIHPSIINHWKREAEHPKQPIAREKIPIYLAMERRLFDLFSTGMRSKEVANVLGYSEKGINSIMQFLYRYHGVNKRSEWLKKRGEEWSKTP